MKKSISLITLLLVFVASMVRAETAEEWVEKGKEAKELDEKINCYRKAIDIDTDYMKAHNNLGIAYAKKGMLDEAIFEFEEVLTTEPNNRCAHKNLGISYMYKGSYILSAKHYYRAYPPPIGALVIIALALIPIAISLSIVLVVIMQSPFQRKFNEAVFRKQLPFLEKYLDEGEEVQEKCGIIHPLGKKIEMLYVTSKKLILVGYNWWRLTNPSTCKEIPYDNISTILLEQSMFPPRNGLRITYKDKTNLYLKTIRTQPLKKIYEVINKNLIAGSKIQGVT